MSASEAVLRDSRLNLSLLNLEEKLLRLNLISMEDIKNPAQLHDQEK